MTHSAGPYEHIDRLLQYLVALAPEFFGARIKPATQEEVDRLAAAAMRPLPPYHRDFLLAFGNTPTDAIDPFLNGRAFNIGALSRGYERLARCGANIPEDVSIFSAPEYLDEFEFLQSQDDREAQVLIGTVNFDSGEFFPDEVSVLEDHLLEFAFTFRIAQLDHVLDFVPRSDMSPDPGLQVMARMGLAPVFRLSAGVTCLEGGPWASVIFSDGSGHIASDDHRALLEICELLADQADMEIKPRPNPLTAPKR